MGQPELTLDEAMVDLEAEKVIKADFSRPQAAIVTSDPMDSDVVIGTFKRWSASAVECYVRKANCDGCYYAKFFDDKPYGCKMYLAVDQLLETLGEPSKNLLSKYG